MSIYSPAYICSQLGQPGLHNAPHYEEADSALRVLLNPGHHAQVLITLTRTGEKARGEIVCARDSVYADPDYCGKRGDLPRVLWNHLEIETEFLEEMLNRFQAFVGENVPPRSTICVDGMQYFCLLKRPGLQLTLEGGAHNGPERILVPLLEGCYHRCRSAFVQNRMVDAARCVHRDLPRVEESRKKYVQLMVLGDDQSREDYFALMHQALDGPAESAPE